MFKYATICAILLYSAATVRSAPVSRPADASLDPLAAPASPNKK